jgi:hypothetical protein
MEEPDQYKRLYHLHIKWIAKDALKSVMMNNSIAKIWLDDN